MEFNQKRGDVCTVQLVDDEIKSQQMRGMLGQERPEFSDKAKWHDWETKDT